MNTLEHETQKDMYTVQVHMQENDWTLGLLIFSWKTLSASPLAASSAADSLPMASASDDMFFKTPFTPEEDVGEASPAPVSMEEERVQSSPASSSWPMMGLVRWQLGSDMGCSRGCTAVRVGLEECSSPGTKECPGRS